MNRIVCHQFFTNFIVPIATCLLLVFVGNTAVGQIDGFPNPGDQGQNQNPTQPVDDGTTNNGNPGGNATDGEIDEVEPLRLTREILDRRNQGFVGPTAPGIEEEGFIGPRTGDPDSEVAEGRFIGGGTNDGLGQRTGTTTSRDLQENGFTVQRRGIRSRLRPAFAAPRTPAYVTERRFQNRMTRQPVVRNFGQGVTVTVSNRTAVLTGVVSSNAEREIIKRQLRLEPGVYGIEDRTTTAR